MKLYHTSSVKVPTPDLRHSRDRLDFGRGFYLTSIREQAVRYGEKFKEDTGEAWLNVYELNEDLTDWHVKVFDSYSEEWLDFVSACRRKTDATEYDMVIGGIADDRVFETVDLYFAGLMSKDLALERLAFQHPNIQYCIRSERLLNEHLRYIESIGL